MGFEIAFWVSLGTLAYVYFGFVAVLACVARFKARAVDKKEILPPVSVIICAYNEERHIRQKIENCMELDYPKDRMEIIVVSDGSTDSTCRILEEISNPLVAIQHLPQRSGKTECQNLGVSVSKNEVLFFTDATTFHPPDALRILLQSLNDPTIGCVTGRPVFKGGEGLTAKGLGKREKYELYLRTRLGKVSSLFGAQDCIYAVPRRLWSPLRKDLDSGFVGPLQILQKGYRVVYEPQALAFVSRNVPSMKDEFIRRSRIVLRGMRGLLHMRELMNPFRYGFLSLSLISTRLLRWLSPIFLLVLFVSNVFLLDRDLYAFTFLLQVGFYLLAAAGFFLEKGGHRVGLVFSIPLYYCILMCSAAVGLARLLAGETGQVWQTRR